MARKNIQDDEIIELTESELIEDGQTAKPAAAAASYANAAQAPTESATDFEALLAASEAKDSVSAAPVDANEQLDMPEMGDIDNLLESLDIPPQPRQMAQPAAAAGNMKAPELGLSDLDSILDDLEPAHDASAKAQAAPDLDNLLNDALPGANSPKTNIPDIDADLDDILAAVEPPKPQPKQAEPALDDLDSLLEEPKPQPKSAAPAIDDLDSLLEEPKPQPKQAEPALDDLDSLLEEPKPQSKPTEPAIDDLDSLLEEPKPQSKPAAPALDDLDSLLEEPKPHSKPTAPAMDDLDSLLEESKSQPKQTAAAPAIDDLDSLLEEPKPQPKPAEAALDDLDSLLEEPKPQPKQAEPALDDLDSLLEEPKSQPKPAAPPIDDLDSFLGEPQPKQDQAVEDVEVESAEVESVELPPTLDNLLADAENEPGGAPEPAGVVAADSLPATAAMQAYPPELVAGVCRSLLGAQGSISQELMQSISRDLGAQSAHVDDLAKQSADLNNRLRECENRLTACDVRLDAMEKNAAKSLGPEALLAEGAAVHDSLKNLVTGAVGDALQNHAPQPVQDLEMVRRMGDLEKGQTDAQKSIETVRSALTADLANLSEVISGLEQRQAALESRLNDLSTLSEAVVIVENRVDQLEQKMAALGEVPAAITQPDISGLESRIAELTERLTAFTDNFDARVEKAAAGAAARILQEEIARLLADN